MRGTLSGDVPRLQLVLRFFLEMTALIILGMWGYSASESLLRYLTMLAAPLAAATLWGVFAVSGDPSRGAAPVVEIPGVVRLALELGFFASAALALVALEKPMAAGMGVLVVLGHYVGTSSRVRWLLTKR